MLVADPALVTGDMIEDVLKFKRLDGVDAALNDDRATRSSRAAGRATLLRDRLGEVEGAGPGRLGARGPRSCRPRTAQGLPGSVQVTVLDHAGHLAHMEKSKEVNELVLAGLG